MKVVIGSTDYDLKLVAETVLDGKMNTLSDGKIEDGGVCAGCLERFENVISINKKYTHQTRKQTFWHEAVHAMLDELGEEELCEDEGFVDAMAKQIYSFINRNKIDKIYEYLGGRNERSN